VSGKGRDVAASVRQRLLDLSRERGEEFQSVLTRYGMERLLVRLSLSPHGGEFVLKGAMLFTLWTRKPHRATRDLDLLGRGTVDIARLEGVFREICGVAAPADGVLFDATSVRGTRIREDMEYEGVRLRLDARLGQARIAIQVDVGFGDAVTPRARRVSFPTLLDLPAPVVRVYPRETVVAEKFHAIVALGIANTRMKDFFDLWSLAREFEFDGRTLSRAIEATFARRRTPLPAGTPLGLSESFARDPGKATQWTAFVRKGRLLADPPGLPGVVGVVRTFVLPPAAALAAGEPFARVWTAGGPWAALAAEETG